MFCASPCPCGYAHVCGQDCSWALVSGTFADASLGPFFEVRGCSEELSLHGLRADWHRGMESEGELSRLIESASAPMFCISPDGLIQARRSRPAIAHSRAPSDVHDGRGSGAQRWHSFRASAVAQPLIIHGCSHSSSLMLS